AGYVAFVSCTMSKNSANGSPASGGAIYHGTNAGAVLTLSNVSMTENGVVADRSTLGITSIGTSALGGALYNGLSANLFDCLIASNSVHGGLGVVGAGSGSGQGGDGKGAGIYNLGNISVARCALIQNSGYSGAGGSNASAGVALGGGIINEGSGAWLI